MTYFNFPFERRQKLDDSLRTIIHQLFHLGFHELNGVGGHSNSTHFTPKTPGGSRYFQRKGECVVHLLKDGRIHVLHGPLATWKLHDQLEECDWQILAAFASLNDDLQQAMTQYMQGRCQSYADMFRCLPCFAVDWKEAFLCAYHFQQCARKAG